MGSVFKIFGASCLANSHRLDIAGFDLASCLCGGVGVTVPAVGTEARAAETVLAL